MNRSRLATSDEGWGPIYGPQCFLTSKQRKLHLLPELQLTVEVCRIKPANFFGHLIAVVAGESHRLEKVEVSCDCKMTIEARGFRRCVVGYGQ